MHFTRDRLIGRGSLFIDQFYCLLACLLASPLRAQSYSGRKSRAFDQAAALALLIGFSLDAVGSIPYIPTVHTRRERGLDETSC